MSIHSAPYSIIIDALTEARKSKPLKQAELAEMWQKSERPATAFC